MSTTGGSRPRAAFKLLSFVFTLSQLAMASSSSSSDSSDSSAASPLRGSKRKRQEENENFHFPENQSVFGGASLRSSGSRRSLASSLKEDNQPPIDHSAAKPCKCGFCGMSSSDASPIEDPTAEDDRVPWGKYRKLETPSGVVRVAVGTHCGICRNVYRLLGYQHKFGAHSNYLKKLEAKQVDHNPFVAARSEYVRKYKAGGPGGGGSRFRTGKKDREQVKAATTLSTVNQSGVRFEAPELTLVDVNDS